MKSTRALRLFLYLAGSAACLTACTVTTPNGSATVDSGAAVAFAKIIAEK
jgi:hypothetical protein